MFSITNPQIEEYIKSLININDPILAKMEKYGHYLNFPIVDRIVGQFLYFITTLKNPSLIVELGSGFGYSAYWFAKALKDGKVVLNEYQQKNIQKAKQFFEKGGLIKKAIFEIGDALENAKKYQNIDILFLDHEKSRYLEAIQTLEERLSENALIIADNVLWHGKVIEKSLDKQTKKILEFNDYMFNSKKFISSLLPLRDGLLIAMKK